MLLKTRYFEQYGCIIYYYIHLSSFPEFWSLASFFTAVFSFLKFFSRFSFTATFFPLFSKFMLFFLSPLVTLFAFTISSFVDLGFLAEIYRCLSCHFLKHHLHMLFIFFLLTLTFFFLSFFQASMHFKSTSCFLCHCYHSTSCFFFFFNFVSFCYLFHWTLYFSLSLLSMFFLFHHCLKHLLYVCLPVSFLHSISATGTSLNTHLSVNCSRLQYFLISDTC